MVMNSNLSKRAPDFLTTLKHLLTDLLFRQRSLARKHTLPWLVLDSTFGRRVSMNSLHDWVKHPVTGSFCQIQFFFIIIKKKKNAFTKKGWLFALFPFKHY